MTSKLKLRQSRTPWYSSQYGQCIALLVAGMATAHADPVVPEPIHYAAMTITLLGGLALFLFGMDEMSQALKQAAGDRMRTLLQTLTANRLSGVMTGTGITAIIQSSSVTTVLVVGFISAGLLNLNQAVAVIMGANIGTTITAQIIAFKVTKAALAMVAIGFFIRFISQQEQNRHYGNILLGLGMIFLGMNLMSEAMSPLRSYQPFIELMQHMDNLLLAIVIAAGFTALVQSSSATTGIVIVLAGQGFISLESGIALAMGANIGTCVTALLAALGKPREAMQTAAVHVSFNLLGVLMWLPLLHILVQASLAISPSHPELMGSERLAAELPRQIANANTLFNVLNTAIMLPFAGLFVWFVKKLIPQNSSDQRPKVTPKYLSKELLATPELALEQTKLEISRVGRRVCNMMDLLPPLSSDQTTADEKQSYRQQLKEIEWIEDEVDRLHSEILKYLGQLSQQTLSTEQSALQVKLIGATDQLENVADLVVENMLPLAYKALTADIHISPMMHETLSSVQQRVHQALLDCTNAIRRDDDSLAEQVLNAKRELNAQQDAVLAHQAERLGVRQDHQLKIFRYEMEWLESLKRIYSLSKRIAKLQLRKPMPPS